MRDFVSKALEAVFKADAASGDLSSGGVLPDDAIRPFILQPLQNTAVIGDARYIDMRAPTWKEPKLVPPSRALKPGNEAAALPVNDRSKVTMAEVQLDAVTMKSEVRLPDEFLEESVEGNALRDKVLGYIGQVAVRDMEDSFLNGDTASADSTLALQDGLVKLATTVTLDHGGALPSKALFGQIERAIGKAFRGMSGFRHYLPTDAVSQWREKVADRVDAEGTRVFVGGDGGPAQVTGNGYRVIAADLLPDSAGANSNEGTALSTSPDNLLNGVFREMRVKFYEDVPAGVQGAVSRIRWAAGIEWLQGICKTTAIQSGDV